MNILTFSEDNFFTVLQRGGRGSWGSYKEPKPHQMSENPFTGFLSNTLLHWTLQASCHLCDGEYLNCNHPQPEFCSAKYLHSMVKTPLGIPGVQRWKPPPGFAGITKLSPKTETPLESTGAPPWPPPCGICRDCQHPDKKSDIPASTDRGTDPTPAGGVHHGDELSRPGCMWDNDHWHDDMLIKCDGLEPTWSPYYHHQRNAGWAVYSRRYLGNRGLKRIAATPSNLNSATPHFSIIGSWLPGIFCRAVFLKCSHTIELLICCSYRLFCLNVIPS